MARELTWRRNFAVEMFLDHTTFTGWDVSYLDAALINSGETLTRTIIDLTWWRRATPLGETETQHKQPRFLGVQMTVDTAFNPSLNPAVDVDSQEWIWWQLLPETWQDPLFFNDDWWMRGSVHVDTSAQRLAPIDGTADGIIWVVCAQTDMGAFSTPASGFQVGVSCGILLAPLGP